MRPTGYGSCEPAPTHVLSISYFGAGLSTACCLFPVGADPNVASGQIEIVDCANNLIFGSGYIGVVNGNATCTCDAVPTSENTWGGVKALYQ